MNNPDYQTVYGVGLLDDLHNYFPAFLYEQGRFQTLPQAFSYFRHQLNTRFNLFSYGASLHRESMPTQPSLVPSFAPSFPPSFPPSFVPPSFAQPRQTAASREATELAADVASLNFLTTLLGGREPIRMTSLGSLGAGLGAGLGAQPRGPVPHGTVPMGLGHNGPAVPLGLAPDIWAAFTAPVPVVPSATIIATNTELVSGSTIPLTQRNCSVCQDVIIPTEECRRLRPCQHVYHRSCIDQWFLRSVACPTCRHDIRVATPPSPRLMATVPAPAPPPTDLSGATPDVADAPVDEENESTAYF